MKDNKKSRKLFNNVVQVILTLKSQMHSFECEEYLIAPSDVAKARSLLVSERTLYNIKDIARSVLIKCNVSDNNNTKNVGIEQIVGAHDPFLCIAPSITKALFSAKLPLPDHQFQHIVNKCSYFSSLLNPMSIKERFCQFSVFAGRNPLVSIS